MTPWVHTLLDRPLRIVLVILLAIVIRHLTHRVISRVAESIASGEAGLGRLNGKLPTMTLLNTSSLLSARREQRARTTASVLRSTTTATVFVVTALTLLPLLDIPIAPLLASAGVIGVALGLGTQTLIKDVLAGLFMIVEDQYGVGDVVDLGTVAGMVESIGLRVTRLRSEDGTVWYIRNGEVTRVGNQSQGWSHAILDVTLEQGLDLDLTQALVLDVARHLATDDVFATAILAEPEVLGLEAVTKDTVALRLMVRTAPLRQLDVARELRRRILERFAAEHLPAPVGLTVPGTSTTPSPSS
jgi:small-conductance mechanosensitive channel